MDKATMALERKLLSTDDAMVWAEEFVKVVQGGATVDEGLMVGWFANAMVTAVNLAKTTLPAHKCVNPSCLRDTAAKWCCVQCQRATPGQPEEHAAFCDAKAGEHDDLVAGPEEA